MLRHAVVDGEQLTTRAYVRTFWSEQCAGILNVTHVHAVFHAGSMLEGGGQILRNAASLAAVTGQSLTVEKIRAGRANPGLSPQHLTGLQLTAAVSQGVLEGGLVRSTCITLQPGPSISVGEYTADTKTAGRSASPAQPIPLSFA
jgi:RNA 3'-terminal phosphate cyclase